MAVAGAAALVLAALYLLPGLASDGGIAAPIMSGALTALLLGLAWVLSRSGRTWHALTIVMTAVAASGVTGNATARALDLAEIAPVIAGIALTVVAASSIPLLRDWRELLSVPIIVGATYSMLLGGRIAFEQNADRVPIILAGLFAVAILAVPRLALRASGLDHDDPRPDPKQTAKAYTRGQRLMISFWVAAALSLMLLTPGTVGRGNGGIAVIAISTLLLALAAPRSHGRLDVAVCYLGGLATAITLAVSTMLIFPGYWAAVIIALLVAVVLIVAFGLIIDRSFTWSRRLADIAEMVATVAVVPTVVLPLGLW